MINVCCADLRRGPVCFMIFISFPSNKNVMFCVSILKCNFIVFGVIINHMFFSGTIKSDTSSRIVGVVLAQWPCQFSLHHSNLMSWAGRPTVVVAESNKTGYKRVVGNASTLT